MSTKLWQLRKVITQENISDPQPLPENWGPIFGLEGFKHKIGNLEWTGDPSIADLGWFETNILNTSTTNNTTVESLDVTARQTAIALLRESDWTMLPDVPMSSSKKLEWQEYRKKLREINLQPGFPDTIGWPNKPE